MTFTDSVGSCVLLIFSFLSSAILAGKGRSKGPSDRDWEGGREKLPGPRRKLPPPARHVYLALYREGPRPLLCSACDIRGRGERAPGGWRTDSTASPRSAKVAQGGRRSLKCMYLMPFGRLRGQGRWRFRRVTGPQPGKRCSLLGGLSNADPKHVSGRPRPGSPLPATTGGGLGLVRKETLLLLLPCYEGRGREGAQVGPAQTAPAGGIAAASARSKDGPSGLSSSEDARAACRETGKGPDAPRGQVSGWGDNPWTPHTPGSGRARAKGRPGWAP